MIAILPFDNKVLEFQTHIFQSLIKIKCYHFFLILKNELPRVLKRLFLVLISDSESGTVLCLDVLLPITIISRIFTRLICSPEYLVKR